MEDLVSQKVVLHPFIEFEPHERIYIFCHFYVDFSFAETSAVKNKRLLVKYIKIASQMSCFLHPAFLDVIWKKNYTSLDNMWNG